MKKEFKHHSHIYNNISSKGSTHHIHIFDNKGVPIKKPIFCSWMNLQYCVFKRKISKIITSWIRVTKTKRPILLEHPDIYFEVRKTYCSVIRIKNLLLMLKWDLKYCLIPVLSSSEWFLEWRMEKKKTCNIFCYE